MQEGWHKPQDQEAAGRRDLGDWFKPKNALSEEQLAELRKSPPSSIPEPQIGAEPAQTGAWFKPAGSPQDAPPAPEPQPDPKQGLFDYLARINPENVGQFDPSKSKMLQGIQPNLGEFKSEKSGALPGIGAEPDLGQFDDAKSGALDGVNAQAEAAAFDAAKSGALPGIGAEPQEPQEPQEAQEPQPQPDPYANVEAQVVALRDQYQSGALSREDFQTKLRELMILDDAGRWWMLGLESNRWYRYDGQEWVADEPPRPQVVAGSAVRTETGLQEVPGAVQVNGAGIELDANNLPLPARVPVDDPGATLVGQRAFALDDQSPFDAPTLANLHSASSSDAVDATLPSVAAPSMADQQGLPPLDGAFAADPAIQQPVPPQRGPKMIGIQPDYSEAFSGHWDRAALQKWGLRVVVFGGIGSLALIFVVILGMLLFYLAMVNKYQGAIDALDDVAGSFETTIIYDSEGNPLAEFNDPRGGARKSIPLAEISPFLLHATISTEDETYYENPGFSIIGIIRATVRNLQTGGGGGGASTITQQLARGLVLDAEFASQRSAQRKIEEIVVAAEIARKYSKNEILQFYLNEIYYGNRAYGIEAASQVYFNKPARDLNIAEAAFLAGLPQAPAVYDPVVNRPAAVGRMQSVLRLMTEANGNGCIQMQHEPYSTQPFCVTRADLDNQYVVQIAEVQIKTFNPPTYAARYPHFVNYVWQQLERDYGAQRIYSSGFRVYTTIVPSIQDAAQKAVLDEIPITPRANNGAVIAIRPRDGAVLAMVGSADFDNEEIDGQVNVLFTPQQPGSSIKPLVYVATMEGVSNSDYWYPGTIIWDVPSVFGGNYEPVNFSRTFSGPVTMRYALGQSLNIPAIKGLAFVGTERFTQVLDRMGVDQPFETPVEAGLPSAIGGIEVYPFEMGVAFATLANGGVRQNPYAIQRILNRSGEEIYTAPENSEGVQVIRPQHAYLISHILSDPSVKVVSTLNIPGWRAAAKTGTTNDNRDVWTVGYTPEVAVAVWVGRTDNQPMSTAVLGSNTAAPVWNKTMQAALAGIPARDFPVPEGIVQVQVCRDSGAIFSADTCPSGESFTEVSFSQQPPPPPDRGFLTTVAVDGFSNLLANENCPDFVEQRTFVNINDLTAIAWLNNNPTGQAWAQARNISIPVSAPPTESCQPGQQRPQVIVAAPGSGQQVSGFIEIRGTVSNVPGFTGYQFQIADSAAPEAFSGPAPGSTVYTNQQPSANSLLGTVDFTGYPNGNYILRLVVTGQNNATANRDVPVVVNNTTAPPPPADIFTATPAPSLTPFVPDLLPTATDIPPVEGQGGVSEEFDIIPTPEGGGEFEALPPSGN